jgi:N-acetylglucosaminyl-diphospho-decaprenol L-rhamnosyltransferase
MSQVLSPWAVVVVSFGSEDELDNFLSSLAHSTVTPDHVVIVENGPHQPRIAQHPFPITFIHRPDNPGYGSAVNSGFQAVPAEITWVLVSNPDVELQPGAMRNLLTVATSEPSVGSIGPALINTDGSVYPSARAVPGIGVGIGHALFSAIWTTNPWSRAYRGHYETSDRRDCGWLSGACVLVNRHAFEEIGGFDPGFFMFMEDVDLGMRLGQAGYRNVYVPDARAHHSVGHSTSLAKNTMVKAHHASAKRFIAKRYPGALFAPLRLVLNVGLSVRQWIVQTLQGRNT